MGASTSDKPVHASASSEASTVDEASTSDMSMAYDASTSDAPMNAASASSWNVRGYNCYPRLNCYRGHGAVEIDYWDINRGRSSYACADACNKDWNCEGFV